MTKFETALQVSVLIWVLVLWDGAVKRLLVKSKETVGNSWTLVWAYVYLDTFYCTCHFFLKINIKQ